ncbi:tyrosine-type recombinase/integrase [Tamaricihabitans halophyticus]|uniref:tyrosine-type recombinase/integrase n=1 Tax=Tamaricihabitans halophyticus TaxID=1262583 RepID=UPI001FB3DB57|nr:tyrosine-type recombinase/integrase [Tamaricihabitans halophyticus]
MTKQDLPRPAASVWCSYLDEWDRSLRARNRPQTTRYNYQLAVTQLAEFLRVDLPGYLVSCGAGSDALSDDDAAEDPTDVAKAHVEWFVAWMIETRSVSTALNKYKCVQQFFNYLVQEEEMARHPMERMSQPDGSTKLVPVLSNDEVAALVATCSGKSFIDRRDLAIIRLLFDTGGRLSEVALLPLDGVDQKRDCVLLHGKGDKQRVVPFGPKTGQALVRYLRARAKHAGSKLPELWLAERGGRAFSPNGVKLMLRRRGRMAGIENMHAHRLRHTLAHEWQLAGGNEGDLMAVMGWSSREMLRHYGASAAEVRAQEAHRSLDLGSRV